MPSHIFVRLGLWDDSIRANEESADAARAHVQKSAPGASSFDELHALDYLAYAFLQEGRDKKAREILDQVRAVSRLDNPNFAAAYALAAVPARYALERGRWADAAALEVAPPWFPWDKFPYAEAITHHARAIGAARSGDIAARPRGGGRACRRCTRPPWTRRSRTGRARSRSSAAKRRRGWPWPRGARTKRSRS